MVHLVSLNGIGMYSCDDVMMVHVHVASTSVGVRVICTGYLRGVLVHTTCVRAIVGRSKLDMSSIYLSTSPNLRPSFPPPELVHGAFCRLPGPFCGQWGTLQGTKKLKLPA